MNTLTKIAEVLAAKNGDFFAGLTLTEWYDKEYMSKITLITGNITDVSEAQGEIFLSNEVYDWGIFYGDMYEPLSIDVTGGPKKVSSYIVQNGNLYLFNNNGNIMLWNGVVPSSQSKHLIEELVEEHADLSSNEKVEGLTEHLMHALDHYQMEEQTSNVLLIGDSIPLVFGLDDNPATTQDFYRMLLEKHNITSEDIDLKIQKDNFYPNEERLVFTKYQKGGYALSLISLSRDLFRCIDSFFGTIWQPLNKNKEPILHYSKEQ